MKGAVRQVYDTDGDDPVPDDGHFDDALRVAGHAARSFLLTEGVDYDRSKSEPYFAENFDPETRSREDVIRDGLRGAWSKVDSGKHAGGARIAISVADYYLEAFDPP